MSAAAIYARFMCWFLVNKCDFVSAVMSVYRALEYSSVLVQNPGLGPTHRH